jgi:hypothetical protein
MSEKWYLAELNDADLEAVGGGKLAGVAAADAVLATSRVAAGAGRAAVGAGLLATGAAVNTARGIEWAASPVFLY